jgi:hypothetical protein
VSVYTLFVALEIKGYKKLQGCWMKSIFSLIIFGFSSLATAGVGSGSNVEIYTSPYWIQNVSANGGLVSNVDVQYQGNRCEKLVVMSKEGSVQFTSEPQIYAWAPITALSADSTKLYYTDRSRSILMMASQDGETNLGSIAIDQSVYISEIIPSEFPDLLILRYSPRIGLRNQTNKVALFSIAQGKNISVVTFPNTEVFIRFVEGRYLAIHTHKGGYSLYEMTDGGLVTRGGYSGYEDHKFATLDVTSSVRVRPDSSNNVYATILGFVDEPRINQRMKVGVWDLQYGPVPEAKYKIVELPYQYVYGSYPRVEDGFLLSPSEAVILVALESQKKLVKVNFTNGQTNELLTSRASDGQYGMNHQSKAFWSWDTVVRFNP